MRASVKASVFAQYKKFLLAFMQRRVHTYNVHSCVKMPLPHLCCVAFACEQSTHGHGRVWNIQNGSSVNRWPLFGLPPLCAFMRGTSACRSNLHLGASLFVLTEIIRTPSFVWYSKKQPGPFARHAIFKILQERWSPSLCSINRQQPVLTCMNNC